MDPEQRIEQYVTRILLAPENKNNYHMLRTHCMSLRANRGLDYTGQSITDLLFGRRSSNVEINEDITIEMNSTPMSETYVVTHTPSQTEIELRREFMNFTYEMRMPLKSKDDSEQAMAEQAGPDTVRKSGS